MDGQIEFDNNLTENAIRPTNLATRTGCSLAASKPVGAAPSSTPLSSRSASTGRDPFAYFEWVFEKLMHNPGPEELEALLPVQWIRTQESASQTIEVEVA